MTSAVPFFHVETSLDSTYHQLTAIASVTIPSPSTLNTCRPLASWQPRRRRWLIKAIEGEWSRHVPFKSYSPTSKRSLIMAHLIAAHHLSGWRCFISNGFLFFFLWAVNASVRLVLLMLRNKAATHQRFQPIPQFSASRSVKWQVAVCVCVCVCRWALAFSPPLPRPPALPQH